MTAAATRNADLADAALVAWRALQLPPSASGGLSVERTASRRVFRIRSTASPVDTVVAKQMEVEEGAYEEHVYRCVLGRLHLPVPALLGTHRDPTDLRQMWLFYSDAGDRTCMYHRSRNSAAAAAAWLARLHLVSSQQPDLSRQLQPKTTREYRGHVADAMARLCSYRQTGPSTGPLSELVAAVMGELEQLDFLWAPIADFADAMPQCMVHGDYKPDNIRLLDGSAVVLDFEDSGWGSPVIDLWWLAGVHRYHDLAGSASFLVSTDDLELAISVGQVLREVAAANWASMTLVSDTPEAALSHLQHCLAELPRAIARLRRAPGWGVRR